MKSVDRHSSYYALQLMQPTTWMLGHFVQISKEKLSVCAFVTQLMTSAWVKVEFDKLMKERDRGI